MPDETYLSDATSSNTSQGERGDTGDTGQQGKRGDVGKRGDTGDTGARGDTGPRGDRGQDFDMRLVSDSLSRLESSTGRVESRMDNLVETTNHRLDVFNAEIAKKADIDNLGFVMVHRLMRSRVLWIATALYVMLFAPIIVDHWYNLMERFPGLPVHF